MSSITGWAASAAGQPLKLATFDVGELGAEEVEVAVDYCGICHSDLSMINNEWGNARYPFIPGHEVVGRVTALGAQAKGLSVGQRVGIGWTAESCMHCRQCLSGDQNLCAQAVATIGGHHGGFADKLRAHWAWTIPLPEGIDLASAGPLLCGGITVLKPFLAYDIKPTARVGVVGIGGLGHLAVKFAAAWGCEVTAFTSTLAKADEARSFGAHHVVASRDSAAIKAIAGSLDLLLVTVNVAMDWNALLGTLAPKGRMHVVGAVLEPIPVPAFSLIAKQREVSGSPTGSPVDIARMLDFAARHDIRPQVEMFPLAQVNEALQHLADGKARYRVVLEAPTT
ncbi:alcohol dehydrogenase [Rhodanobacter thiooxydans]|uniref:alcohol dehydrogenase (NADP(+)) n=1 Tax=Rhodanobacter thiooxydans TaxID=416169 RepID=A0A154QL94_9GAMM|nr:NAD(P)-dependent alcohol dehydrogenase [Rhodanobacter thiooxydans]EIL99532.1 zinc-containing alcohol dehydrogenase superfamily protein [Rhodanobacter thiooxydans LCS2]KZC24995.1 alcohol dehydrogenase [Rhodanobacter thiooxydans]